MDFRSLALATALFSGAVYRLLAEQTATATSSVLQDLLPKHVAEALTAEAQHKANTSQGLRSRGALWSGPGGEGKADAYSERA